MATKKTAYEAPTPASDKKKALQTALAQIDKNFGKGTVMRLGDRPEMNVEAIPTGSLALDAALGIGGVPKGRIIEIYGPALGDEVAVLHVGIWRTMEGRGAETDATALVVARRGATVHRGRSAGCRQGGGPP